MLISNSNMTGVRIRPFIFLVLMIGTIFAGVSYSQSSENLSIVGPVVAVETPEFSWPMEFEAVKIFYVRVDKVVKGTFDDKYIRIGYGYNPSHSPQSNLPTELFNGKTVWKFNVSKMSGFERDTLPTVKTQAERAAELKEPDRAEDEPLETVNDELIAKLPGDKKDLRIAPAYHGLKYIVGCEAEKEGLEAMNTIQSYWLDFTRSDGLKQIRSTR